LRKILYDGFLDDLPPALQIIDQEQQDILTAMAASDAPVQVIHALAGSGKSTILQCLVALFAKHHAEQLGLEAPGAAPLDSEAGSVLVFILRTRTMRHKFLQTLMHNQVLQPRQVIFGGASPRPLLGGRRVRRRRGPFSEHRLVDARAQPPLAGRRNC
jgi:hypothetical protein